MYIYVTVNSNNNNNNSSSSSISHIYKATIDKHNNNHYICNIQGKHSININNIIYNNIYTTYIYVYICVYIYCNWISQYY